MLNQTLLTLLNARVAPRSPPPGASMLQPMSSLQVVRSSVTIKQTA